MAHAPPPSLLLFRSYQLTAFQWSLSPTPLSAFHRSSHSRLRYRICVPASSVHPQHRILHLLSIGYASPPRLRSRLPQGRSALPWKPQVFGLEDSHFHLATHSGILSPYKSTTLLSMASALYRCSPTDSLNYPMASEACFSPVYFRRGTSRLVSYYALFECVAASEPTS